MEELTPSVRAFLAEPRFAVVATVDPDGSPQQTVLWYDLDGSQILLNTARGRVKDRNLRRDPRISFCVEDGYRYVTLEGMVEVVDDQTVAQEDIARLAARYHWPARGAEMAAQFRTQERVTLRMSIHNVIAHGFE